MKVVKRVGTKSGHSDFESHFPRLYFISVEQMHFRADDSRSAVEAFLLFDERNLQRLLTRTYIEST